MPMAGYKDFDACVLSQTGKGHSTESAHKICGAIKARVEGTKLTENLSEKELTAVNSEIKDYIVKTYGENITIDNVEIFKAGTWNGDVYTEAEIEALVANFNALSDRVKPPVKLGHNEEQDLLKRDGLPAAGWVTKLRKVGNTVVATLSDVPSKIAELIKKKAYKRVSAEIYPQYISGGNKFNTVLRAIALLGGDIPAVESLADVIALYSDLEKSDNPFKILSFTNEDFNNRGGEINMTPEEIKKLQEVNAELLKENGSLKADIDKFKKDFEELEAKVKAFQSQDEEDKKKKDEEMAKCTKELSEKLEKATKELTEANAKIAKLESEAKSKEINAFIETAKKSGKLLPKLEPAIRSLMENADVTKVLKFTEKNAEGKDVETSLSQFEVIKGLVEGLPEFMKFAEISSTGEVKFKDKNLNGKEVVDSELAEKALAYSEKNKVAYAEALIIVSKEK